MINFPFAMKVFCNIIVLKSLAVLEVFFGQDADLNPATLVKENHEFSKYFRAAE